MDMIGYRPLVRLLYRILTVALYVEIGMAGVVTVTLLMTMISSEDKLLSAWPLEVAEETDYPATTISPHVNNVEVTINRGTVRFSSDSPGYYGLKFLETIFFFALAISITVLLRRLLRSLHPTHPFTPDNARRIRNIAYLVLTIFPYSLIRSAVYWLFTYRTIAIEGTTYTHPFRLLAGRPFPHQVWLDLDVNVLALLIGIVLLIIAEVFRRGVAIQADNESIV